MHIARNSFLVKCVRTTAVRVCGSFAFCSFAPFGRWRLVFLCDMMYFVLQLFGGGGNLCRSLVCFYCFVLSLSLPHSPASGIHWFDCTLQCSCRIARTHSHAFHLVIMRWGRRWCCRRRSEPTTVATKRWIDFIFDFFVFFFGCDRIFKCFALSRMNLLAINKSHLQMSFLLCNLVLLHAELRFASFIFHSWNQKSNR